MVEVARLQARLVERELELAEQRKEAESFLRELQESVECPVCFSIPRAPPVPCCQNGHVICAKCKEKVEVCPTCRVTMTNCVSQVAATIIQKIQHPCDFREAGCEARCDINSIEEHEQSCRFRLVSSRAVTTAVFSRLLARSAVLTGRVTSRSASRTSPPTCWAPSAATTTWPSLSPTRRRSSTPGL